MSAALIFTATYLLGAHLTWQVFISRAVTSAEGALFIWGARNGYLPAMIAKGTFLLCWPLVLGLGHFLAALGWRSGDE